MELFQVDQSGTKQLVASSLVPNPACDTSEAEQLYECLGQIMGACARGGERGDKGGEKLAVGLAPLVWKLLLGREMRWEEVAELEPELHAGLDCILSGRAPDGYKYTEAEFNGAYSDQYDLTVSFGASRPYREMELVAGGASQKLSYRTRHDYVRLVKKAHLAKYTTQIRAMRKGLLQYLPAEVMALWNGYDLESAVAGEPDVAVEKLKSEAQVRLTSAQTIWFWECVDAMTPAQRCKLLRFATGRSRLPVGQFHGVCVCLSVYLFVGLSVCLSVCFVCLFLCLSVYLSGWLASCLPGLSAFHRRYLSVCVCVCMCVRVYVCACVYVCK